MNAGARHQPQHGHASHAIVTEYDANTENTVGSRIRRRLSAHAFQPPTTPLLVHPSRTDASFAQIYHATSANCLSSITPRRIPRHHHAEQLIRKQSSTAACSPPGARSPAHSLVNLPKNTLMSLINCFITPHPSPFHQYCRRHASLFNMVYVCRPPTSTNIPPLSSRHFSAEWFIT